MGVCRVSMIAALATILLVPTIAMGRDYIVGDDCKGWGVGVDYQAWAAAKVFWVGDRLIFKYAAGHDHVYKVNGTSFQSCIFPAPNEGLSSGNDVVVLATPGRKWYIGDHCRLGQKLVITVLPIALPPFYFPPSPQPQPSRSRIPSSLPEKLFAIFH